MLTTNNTLYSPSMIKNETSKLITSGCRICGAPAQYSYFGAISCRACKMFFKRNANSKKKVTKCDYNGECEINITNRHICSSCRLAKCLQCGMTTDKFRSPIQTKPKSSALVKVQAQHQLERLPTLNLLQSDQSLLTTSQWTLLSNLYNGYKESQLLSIGQRLINTHDPLQPTSVIYQALVEELSVSIYENAGNYLRLNDDLCKLSFNDRSIVLRNAADNISCMGGEFVMHHCNLFGLDGFSKIVETMYGKQTIALHLWAMKFMDPDIVVIKLGLSLFAVAENSYFYSPTTAIDLTNSIDIFKIQNKYAEVTWKYLIYRYGHNEAVKRFLNLTLWFMAATIFLYHAQSLILHVHDVNSLVEQTELKFILDDVDRIIETN